MKAENVTDCQPESPLDVMNGSMLSTIRMQDKLMEASSATGTVQ